MAKKKLCHRCNGLCCRYFALPIDTPEDKGDYDDIRWYLCHKAITVFVEEGDWYINIKNRCRYLSANGRKCKIYNKRPRICRGYTTRDCDRTKGDYEYELHFTNDRQMAEYMRVKFENNKKKKVKSKTKKGRKANKKVKK
ncbi:MAG TPA: YkgJ family cysteine cluster protein [Sedimentisphaerales bacterium]|nr:YkgJ family cysteine cluster protein [Sedimentisphaerales bacterium]